MPQRLFSQAIGSIIQSHQFHHQLTFTTSRGIPLCFDACFLGRITLGNVTRASEARKNPWSLRNLLTMLSSLAGSVLTRTYYPMNPSEAPDMDMSPSATARVVASTSHNDSSKSSPELQHNDTITSSDLESPSGTPLEDGIDSGSPEQSNELDAEGSPDTDFRADSPASSNEEHEDGAGSVSEGSTRLGKRKSDAEDEDYIRKDPELYGLRRSVRLCFRCLTCF